MGAFGAALAVLLGVGFLHGSSFLAHLSFDLPFAFRPAVSVNEAVIVYMDEMSRVELNQGYDRWDRSLHAHLLKILTQASAKAVAFDVFFDVPGDAQVDRQLAEAMAAHGKVVTAAVRSAPGALRQRIAAEPFGSASQSGLAEVIVDPDGVIRQHHDFAGEVPSLPQKLAEIVGAKAPVPQTQRWLNYYGSPGVIPRLSYSQVFRTNVPLSLFSGKVVFVGSLSSATDTFPTPFTRWTGVRSPAVEIQATAFLNLLRRDWLTRFTPGLEFSLIILSGLIFGFGLSLLRPWGALGVAVFGIVAVASGAILLFWQTHSWFAWSIVCLVQVPSALLWSILASARRRHSRGDLSFSPSLDTQQHAETKEQLMLKAAEQAKRLGLSADQLQAARVREAVLVSFPSTGVQPGAEILLEKNSGSLLQMSVPATSDDRRQV